METLELGVESGGKVPDGEAFELGGENEWENTYERVVLEAAKTVLGETDFPACVRSLFLQAKKVVGATVGFVGLLRDDGESLDTIFLEHVVADEARWLEGLKDLHEVASHREIEVHNHYQEAPDPKDPPNEDFNYKNLMLVPLILEDKDICVGVWGLANKPTGFGKEDKKVGNVLGRFVAISLHNTRMLEQLKTVECRYSGFVVGVAMQFQWKSNDSSGGVDRRLNFIHGEVLGMTGYPATHYYNGSEQTILDLVVPEDRDRVRAYHNKVGHISAHSASTDSDDKGLANNIKFRIKHKDGSFIWILAIARKVGLNLEVTWQDISSLEFAEEERRKTDAQLQHSERLHSLGVLAGGIAHDFNNLLAGVLGNVQFVQSHLKEMLPVVSSDVSGALDDIEESAGRAAKLSQLMLSYSGKSPVVLKRQDLEAVLRSMAPVIQASYPPSVRFRMQLLGTLPEIDIDATQIQQVIFNLVNNACEAVGEEGHIALSTAVRDVTMTQLLSPEFHVDPDTIGRTSLMSTPLDLRKHSSAIQVRQWKDESNQPPLQDGRFVSVLVKDTGVGMKQEVLDHAFEPFFSTKFPGRGLGLSASLGIVRRHGGAMRAASIVGEGTEIEVLLPIPAATTSAEKKKKTSPSSDPSSTRARSNLVSKGPKDHTILLVDDEAVVRMVASRLLKKGGYNVVLAVDGLDAVEVFAKSPDSFSCVILDLSMPRLDGEGAFKQIHLIRSEVPVIISSGYDRDDVIARFGAAIFGFLPKPYRAEELHKMVADALETLNDDYII